MGVARIFALGCTLFLTPKRMTLIVIVLHADYPSKLTTLTIPHQIKNFLKI